MSYRDDDRGGYEGNKRMRSEEQFYGGAGMAMGMGGGMGMPMGMPMMGGGRDGNNFPACKLRGLPFDAREHDIVGFFQGLDVVDVLIVRRGGKMNGEAFVVFANVMVAEYSLNRNRAMMGRRYIEVFRARKQDYYEAVHREVEELRGMGRDAGGAAFGEGGGEGAEGGGAPDRPARPPAPTISPEEVTTAVIRMRGLPFSASKADIIAFFDDKEAYTRPVEPLVEDNILVVMNHSGRPSGTAFAEFSCVEDAQSAIVKNRATMGGRYVELFPSSRDDAKRAATQGS